MAQTPLHGSSLMERFIAEPTSIELVQEAGLHFNQVANGLQRIALGRRDPRETAEHALRNLATAIELMAKAQSLVVERMGAVTAELAEAVRARQGQ